MELIREIYNTETDDVISVGDCIVNAYGTVEKVNTISSYYVNGRYHRSTVKKVPIEIVSGTIPDSILEHIEERFKLKNLLLQKKLKDEMDYLKIYKVYSNELYDLYKKIKNIEFIPKTLEHLTCLFSAVYNRHHKIG